MLHREVALLHVDALDELPRLKRPHSQSAYLPRLACLEASHKATRSGVESARIRRRTEEAGRVYPWRAGEQSKVYPWTPWQWSSAWDSRSRRASSFPALSTDAPVHTTTSHATLQLGETNSERRERRRCIRAGRECHVSEMASSSSLREPSFSS
eukprot:6200271-Pleurochrysis_carterae.AAC.1